MLHKLYSTLMVVILMISIAACIPSKSEAPPPKEQPGAPTSLSQPEPLELTPTNNQNDDKAHDTKTSNVAVSLAELSSNGLEGSGNTPSDIQKIEEMSLNQGGVLLYAAKDGLGYDVKGAYGLTATLKPDELGVTWVLDGKFEQKTEGFQIGEPKVGGVTDGLPFQTSIQMRGLIMITIPVVLPDINAIETGDTYTTPIHYTVEAEPNATFIINMMPTKSL